MRCYISVNWIIPRASRQYCNQTYLFDNSHQCTQERICKCTGSLHRCISPNYCMGYSCTRIYLQRNSFSHQFHITLEQRTCINVTLRSHHRKYGLFLRKYNFFIIVFSVYIDFLCSCNIPFWGVSTYISFYNIKINTYFTNGVYMPCRYVFDSR